METCISCIYMIYAIIVDYQIDQISKVFLHINFQKK